MRWGRYEIMDLVNELIGNGKIVGLVEIPAEYIYTCPNPHHQQA